MDTLRRPDIRKPSISIGELVADALIVLGLILMVLGTYESAVCSISVQGSRSCGRVGSPRSPT